jgi:hypothetical protein
LTTGVPVHINDLMVVRLRFQITGHIISERLLI